MADRIIIAEINSEPEIWISESNNNYKIVFSIGPPHGGNWITISDNLEYENAMNLTVSMNFDMHNRIIFKIQSSDIKSLKNFLQDKGFEYLVAINPEEKFLILTIYPIGKAFSFYGFKNKKHCLRLFEPINKYISTDDILVKLVTFNFLNK